MRALHYLAVCALAVASIIACSTTRTDTAADAGRSDADAAPVDTGDSSSEFDADAQAPKHQRVLFVGNSYTQVNDLPSVVQGLMGDFVETDSVLVGGATLYQHWTATGARAKVEAGGFDAVVIQGQSQETFGESGFDQYARLFADAINTSKARPLWFATWARGAGTPAEAQYNEKLANTIEQAYSSVARAKGGTVARVV
jgi:hypothetical protein